jgi:hypothetical protein
MFPRQSQQTVNRRVDDRSFLAGGSFGEQINLRTIIRIGRKPPSPSISSVSRVAPGSSRMNVIGKDSTLGNARDMKVLG